MSPRSTYIRRLLMNRSIFRQGILFSLLGLGSLKMLHTWQSTTNGTSQLMPVYAEFEPKYRLVQVHVLCRHGARTPIHTIPTITEVCFHFCLPAT